MTPSLTSRSAVVVNDDPTMLHAVAATLRRDGLAVRTFPGAAEALEAMLESGPPDVIVTDLYMPGVDGWRFCRLLRSPEYPAFNRTPILVLSATFSGEDARRITADLGADGFLATPFDMPQLSSSVQSLLQGQSPLAPPGVVLVSRDEALAQPLAAAFTAHGYRVRRLSAVTEAPPGAQAEAADITVLDGELLGSAGPDAVEALRRARQPAAIVVLMADGRDNIAWMRRGADACLSRQVPPERLVSVCESARRERAILCVEERLEARTRELRASEERFRSLFENSALGIFHYSLSGRPLQVNQAWARIFGYDSPKQVLGSVPNLDETLALDPERREEVLRTVRGKTGMLRFESTCRRRDGTLITALVHLRLVRDAQGREPYLEGFIEDITERKRAEDALRNAIQFNREVISGAGEGIVVYDRELRCVAWNRFMEKLTGTPAAAVLGQCAPEIHQRLGLGEANLDRLVEVALAGDTVSSPDTAYQVDQSGRSGWILGTFGPHRDSKGHVLGVIGLLRDITDRKRLEAQLLQSQKVEGLGQLAGGIAHDFNNLLTGILGYANMIKLNTAPESAVHDAARTIEKAAERAAELTHQLLGFARRGKYLNQPLSVNDVVREVCGLLCRTLDKSISLTHELQTAQATVLGDPTQIQQAILNLAVNARDAMPNGGVLTISTRAVRLDEAQCHGHPSLSPGEYVVVAVRDTGQGMTPEVQARIFEPYFTTKPQGKGTGMGLAMVYGIVRNHGGAVLYETEAGQGTVFELYLPLTNEPLPASIAEGAAPAPGAGRILLVDDEELILKVAAEMLAALGYQPVTALGGEEALRLCREATEPFDAAILDLAMPGMDGRECFRGLKKIAPNLRTILSSGYGPDGKVHELLEEGMDAFIQKPYRMAGLGETLAKVLARR